MSKCSLAALDKDDAQLGMLTKAQLADMLAGVNVEDVARESGVSVKTVYRLRHQRHSPTLDTVEKLLDAIAKLNRQRAKQAEPAKA